VEMVDWVREHNCIGWNWQVRVGLHCGPVVGGIVGTKKYLYDIFGDTVNVAARLQTMSESMQINVSAEVYEQLQNKFVFSCPRHAEMKGKGVQSTYFLEKPQESPLRAAE
jgi:Adenylate cyclase, family 3 (some proteins contain HAMP domain)